MPRPPRLLRLALLAVLVGAGAQAQSPEALADPVARRAAAEARLVRGMLELSLGNDSTAVRHLMRALAFAPGDAAVLDALAEAHATRGEWPTALNHAEAAVRAAPREASLHLQLGQIRARAGLPAEAGQALAEARRLAPAHPDILAALAEHHAAAGDAAAEREVLESLVRIGDTPAARLRLADLYTAADETARARAMLEAARRLAPEEPSVRARLAALDGAARPMPAPVPTDSDDLPPTGDGPGTTDASLDALFARTADDPGDLGAWVRLLNALTTGRDARAPAAADDARLFFPASPAVLAPAADIYAAQGRADDARASARAGLDALDALGASAPSDAAALRARLARHLPR